MIERRAFLRSLAFGAIAPAMLGRLARAAQASKKVLVVVFQRGAVDGLNVVIPYADDIYYKLRPSIAVPRDQVLDLDGHFGLHPALAPLKPFFSEQRLAAIHAAGSPSASRSHFDAQDFMESGTPDVKSTDSGWLNRMLTSSHKPSANDFRAIAVSNATPRILSGPSRVLAFNNLDELKLRDKQLGAPTGATFEAMYDSAVRDALRGPTRQAFGVLHELDAKHVYDIKADNGATYPKDPFGHAMQEIAAFVKADLGVQVAFTDIGGWDTHVSQGAQNGQLANRLKVFAESLAAFAIDLGTRMDDVMVVTMSEFGRTVRENGSHGTDHGHGNVMLVMHGPTHGGKVYGKWPGLDDAHLYEARDLAVTTDFRTVLTKVAKAHLGINATSELFPGFTAPQAPELGFV